VHHFCTVRIEGSDLYFTAVSAAGDTIDQFALIGGTSVEEPGDEPVEGGVSLKNAFPNPFNPVTTIAFSVPETALVELDVLNVSGQVVKVLLSEERQAGEHRVSWDGSDGAGHGMGSGVYFYRLRAGGTVLSRKMVLLK
jgi:hypothetical protein